MMTLRRWSVAIFIVYLLNGCAALEVQTDYDPDIDFSRYKTYQWVPGPQKVTGNPRLDNPLLDKRIRSAVEKELAAKGYVKAENGRPDFKVAYHTALEMRSEYRTIDDFYRGYGYYGYTGWGGRTTYVYQYEEGTLILDIIDAKTNSLVWRGTARAEIMEYRKNEKRDKQLHNIVHRMIAKFPPSRKKK